MLDIHTHILTVWGRKPFTEKDLLGRMDLLGIEKSVLLPLGDSPETNFFRFGTEDAVRVYRRHPDRIIPFCCVDPRAGGNSPETDFLPLLNYYREKGCKGFGELTANLPVDDPLCINLYRQCGEAGMPVLFHLYRKIGGFYGLVDSPGLPGLEKVLGLCPETIFIGHAMVFWDEISYDTGTARKTEYPAGPVKLPGRIQSLMEKYPNLYGDLSAGSGYNAITRDPEYGYDFLNTYRDRLLLGTDLCHQEPDIPGKIVDYFRRSRESGRISETAYLKIVEDNARRILGI